MEPTSIAGPAAQGQGAIAARAEEIEQGLEVGGGPLIRHVRDQDGDQPLGMGGDIAPFEQAAPLPPRALPTESRRVSKDQASRCMG
jgi:hypothetical protein